MLQAQEAQARLQLYRSQDHQEQWLTAVAVLPPHLRPPAWQLLGYDENGNLIDYSQRRERTLTGPTPAQQLEALSAGDRTRLFSAFWPQMAVYVEAGWQLQKGFPYQLHGARRTFRAPGRPDLSLPRRETWLRSLLALSRNYYDQDVVWWAQWAPYLGASYLLNHLGVLLAAAVDSDTAAGDEVFEILLATARGEHEIGAMGRHVVQGLLSASRPQGWTAMEQLLLAAQGQEGLRQVILESIDEAHPIAFGRMVRLIREQRLFRFSSAVRALDVWFGLSWEAAAEQAVARVAEQLDGFLFDEAACAAIFDQVDADAEAVYLALCVTGLADVLTAVRRAQPFLSSARREHRFVAAYFLGQTALPEAQQALWPLLLDDDLRVAAVALKAIILPPNLWTQSHSSLFERLEEALPRFPEKPQALEPLVWPWLALTAHRQVLADALVHARGDRSIVRLLPYVKLMGAAARSRIADGLRAEQLQLNTAKRELLFQLIGDTSQAVRHPALLAAGNLTLTEHEAIRLEGDLRRKVSDLRRGVLSLLLGQRDTAALASASRLLQAPATLQRQAGLELLCQLQDENRSQRECLARAQTYAAGQERLAREEQLLLERIIGRAEAAPTLAHGLGLFDPAHRTRPTPPQPKKRWFRRLTLVTPAAVACLNSLDDLIQQHSQTPVTLTRGITQETSEELLGNVKWGFPLPDVKLPAEEDLARLPLAAIWREWYEGRPAPLRDVDDLELLRALLLTTALTMTGYYTGFNRAAESVCLKIHRDLFGETDAGRWPYLRVMKAVLLWLMRLYPANGAVAFLLQAMETSLAQLPFQESEYDSRRSSLMAPLELARRHRELQPGAWQRADQQRFWGLLRWLDEPGKAVPRLRPPLDDVVQAYHAGAAAEADILDQLIGPRSLHYQQWGGLWYEGRFDDLIAVSGRKPDPRLGPFTRDPLLLALVERVRRRIVEVELGRGDLPTAATSPALHLRYSGGLETLLPLLSTFGTEPFGRGWQFDNQSKQRTFSHLIRVTYPAEDETPQRFVEQLASYKISQRRLVETALYAPQWAGHIEAALAWSQFAEAVWWFHAHTKDNLWQVDQAIREAWHAEINERTPLTGQELLDGAVDVAWFWRVYNALGPEKWGELDAAAKYASGGRGHKRAQLFAAAMLGQVEQADLVRRIQDKRNQDAVRALGLLPLPTDDGREAEILARYLLTQEFVRGSRKFGSQRQVSEKLSAKIGLENLARTAGYANPLRLEWAMEYQAVADLAAGPVTAAAEGVTVTLAIDDLGEPQIRVEKNGRLLKAAPAKARKDAAVAGLLARKQEIRRQASRTRQSLEQAMCRGDHFTGSELQQLLCHPVLKPMLAQLLFIGDGMAGYPVAAGLRLEGLDGNSMPVAPQSQLRLAHPYDLWQRGDWHLWQRECFRRERIQPFKQLFRELYLLTLVEKESGKVSLRYAGHQVSPRHALALLGQRGWVTHPEEGTRRTFHDENITVWLEVDGGYFSPAEVEGLTLAGVSFTRRGEWQTLPLEAVPPCLFSEAMRDVDLVVSVAHRGGVDPEASASTVEMRTTVVLETARLLKLNNVRIDGHHVLIAGQLNNYSVHLGSGVVHQQPGGYICLVPVHSQHRGRLFLPFVDDDPKTAEITAKVVLLARDKTIRDPAILEQILPVARRWLLT
jgi:hypothetical protein